MEKKLDGVLVVDKPSGMTSTQTVEEIKRLLRVKKAGHGGTLDRFATGVLPVFLNSATKVAQIFLEGDKAYEGEFILGIKTDTYDIEGEVLEKKEEVNVSQEEVERVIKEFHGELEQSPPPFSAAKYKGKPLYKYARDGLLITKKPKKIKIYQFKILGFEEKKVKFYLECSKGTYVRSLINEIGEKLGCGAVLSSLRRLKKGVFTLKDAHPLEKIKELSKDLEEIQKLIIPIERALSFLPEVRISKEFAEKVRQGRQIYRTAFLSFLKFQKVSLSPKEKWVKLVTDGELVAIIENPLLQRDKEFVSYFKVFK